MQNQNPIAICNELFEGISFSQLCDQIAHFGYNGIEIAPFTLNPDIRNFMKDDLSLILKNANDHNLQIPAFHWLLVSPPNLHITNPDPEIQSKTRSFFKHLIETAAILETQFLVFGSPQQRSILPNWEYSKAYQLGLEFFREMGDYAQKFQICIAFEPLGRSITNFGGSLADGKKIIKEINHSAVKLHLDIAAMARDGGSISDMIKHTKLEDFVYVHVNDSNQLGPGMGNIDYGPIMDAFQQIRYKGWFSVEPFSKQIPINEIAQKSIAYLRNFL
jgi:sugar phosphate isomerase/epimerase